MWLAETSLSDGIAVVIFATILFLLLLGSVIFVRWVFRIVCVRSAPETIILVFPNEFQEVVKNPEEFWESFENFAWFLHTKLRENHHGHFAGFTRSRDEIQLRFQGPEADSIWRIINAVAQDKAPVSSLRAILKRSKKNGGELIVERVEWTSTGIRLPRPAMPNIPETWTRLSFHGRVLTYLGIGGLFLWGMIRRFLKLTENDFRDTVFGNISAWAIGILLIAGLSLNWLSTAKIRSIAKQAGFPAEDSPTSTILKYVLLLVIIIFALVLMLVV